MKLKALLVIFISLCFFFSVNDVSAQKIGGKRYQNAIGINPISLVWKQLVVNFEFQVDKFNTINIQGLYWFPGDDWVGYGLSGTYRWYIMDLFKDRKIPIQGFSVGPTVGFLHFGWNGMNLYDNYGGTSFAIGGEAAYKWIFNDWVVEPKFQLLIDITSVNGLSGWSPFTLGCSVGYAW
jgi:hypothetical protein